MKIQPRSLKSCVLTISLLSVGAITGCLEESGSDAPSDAGELIMTEVKDASATKTELERPELPAPSQQDIRADESNPRSISGYNPQLHWTGKYSYAKTDIKSHDGVILRAIVTEPAGPGPHPLVVMPSSWAFNRVEHAIPARLWASQGFVVVSYTSRGFHRSGGEIDIADAPTVKDVSSVIDWAREHTKADMSRVGALGISYGGGTALLAAAQDERIDAVVTMSGWADLHASMIPNKTISEQIEKLLVGAAKITGKPGKLLRDVKTIIEEDRLEDLVEPFRKRSAIHKIDALAGTPIMIAQGWNDGAFPMSQMLDFYRAHKGPKSIIMQPGDHATADLGGLLGLPNRSWDAGLNWMRKYVKQDDVDCGPAVVSISNDNKWEKRATSLEAWEGKKTSFSLSDPWKNGFWKEGVLEQSASNAKWKRSFKTGTDTVANSGTVMLTGSKLGFLSLPEMITPAFVLRDHALMWKTPVSFKSQHVQGAPVVQFNIAPKEEELSLFVYLYEEVASVGSLISHAPITLRNLAPGEKVPVRLELEPIDWNLTPGSQMVLIVDSKDPRYASRSGRAKLEIFSTPDHPATLEVPLHQEQ